MRILTAAGEFDVTISRAKHEKNNVTLEGKATAVWSPLPMMGVWDMKMTVTMAEILHMGVLMLSVMVSLPFTLLYRKIVPEKLSNAQRH